jgi:hypothetical protein
MCYGLMGKVMIAPQHQLHGHTVAHASRWGFWNLALDCHKGF